ncbi:septum formation initiator [Halopolyspora algeriensis]|uniref:Septum formation initiator n=1 Tax=Halopolyspora algeriensis TaxID=1500506 RepID=A0A368VH52_9ACTN|nr:septum formation initiator family protein [Halopolyspora algeriensis]RCW39977.1 septum formation initiator [Halopolyspora algeriensis]TQM46586.1 septum formation initiator [Halopolyspora algeriensis]
MPSGRSGDRRRRAGAARGRGKRPGGQGSARPRSLPGTGGAFKLSSTRRAAVLALVVCAMALSVSVPLRTYLSQQEELAMRQQQQAELSRDVRELVERKQRLSDPARIEAEARKRLGYVRPGETPYKVHLPEQQERQNSKSAPETVEKPWYQQLWQSLIGKGS